MPIIADCPIPVIVAVRPADEHDAADSRHIIITTVDGVLYATIRCDKYQERVSPEPAKRGGH